MQRSFKVTPLECIVLLHHVIHSPDAENDADRTVGEIIREIDSSRGYISKGLLESSLYCCNMENESGKFWHPLQKNFDQFIRDLLPKELKFHKYYNVIVERRQHGPETES